MERQAILERVPDDFGEECYKNWKKSRDHSKPWREEAKQCYDFVSGNQWSREERSYLEDQLRPAITFNRIDPVISSVSGHQINNRQELRYLPREQGDVHVNEILTGAASWADDECDGEDEITDSFFDLIVCGMGWTDTRMDYDEQPEGQLRTAERIDPLEMYWDPSSRKRNLADADWVARARWWKLDDAKEEWPKIEQLFAETPPEWATDNDREPHDAARAFLYEQDQADWYSEHQDEVLILQYQYKTRVTEYVIGDPISGRTIRLPQARFNRIKDRVEASNLRYVKQRRKVVKQAFLMGPHTLENGPAPCPYDVSLVCMTGKRDRNDNHWYGMVRGLMDPQRWSNKFFSNIEHILSSNRQGGAFAEEDALVDVRQADQQWSDPSALIMLRQGALAAGKIQERTPIPYPQGMDRLMQISISAIPDVAGVNLEFLGMIDRNQPGILEAQRKQAALTVMAGFFDSLRRHTKMRGRVVLHMIQQHLSDGRLIRITGQDGKERYVPLVRNKEVIRYDVIVDQSPASPNQKHEIFAIIKVMLPFMLQFGVPFPPELMDYLPLPSSLTSKWKEMLQPKKPDPMQKQIVMRQAQQDAAESQAKVQKDVSTAKLNQAKMLETMADIQERLKRLEMDKVTHLSDMIERM